MPCIVTFNFWVFTKSSHRYCIHIPHAIHVVLLLHPQLFQCPLPFPSSQQETSGYRDGLYCHQTPLLSPGFRLSFLISVPFLHCHFFVFWIIAFWLIQVEYMVKVVRLLHSTLQSYQHKDTQRPTRRRFAHIPGHKLEEILGINGGSPPGPPVFVLTCCSDHVRREGRGQTTALLKPSITWTWTVTMSSKRTDNTNRKFRWQRSSVLIATDRQRGMNDTAIWQDKKNVETVELPNRAVRVPVLKIKAWRGMGMGDGHAQRHAVTYIEMSWKQHKSLIHMLSDRVCLQQQQLHACTSKLAFLEESLCLVPWRAMFILHDEMCCWLSVYRSICYGCLVSAIRIGKGVWDREEVASTACISEKSLNAIFCL